MFGYKEEGTITTSFDMRVRNNIDRCHLLMTVAEVATISAASKKKVLADMAELLDRHHKYIVEYGVDLPEIADWKWQ